MNLQNDYSEKVINICEIEASTTFVSSTKKPFFRDTVPWVIKKLGGQEFTRTHVQTFLIDNEIHGAHPEHGVIEENVRQEIMALEKTGIIKRTGSIKYGRLIYVQVAEFK